MIVSKEPLFIGISGIIAAGKSTLAKALAKMMGLPVYMETAATNKYMADFYKDMKKYGYPLQIDLLTDRYNQQQKIVWNAKGAVQDRTIYEDSIFCKMLCDDGFVDSRDYETYEKLSKIMFNLMKRPDLIVHLDISPEESFRRLKIRNRNIESEVPLAYLQKLHKYYDDFLIKISKKIRVIRVKYDKKYKIEYKNQKEFDEKMENVAKKMATDIKKEWENKYKNITIV
jgi:deoxyadenosine kinase